MLNECVCVHACLKNKGKWLHLRKPARLTNDGSNPAPLRGAVTVIVCIADGTISLINTYLCGRSAEITLSPFTCPCLASKASHLQVMRLPSREASVFNGFESVCRKQNSRTSTWLAAHTTWRNMRGLIKTLQNMAGTSAPSRGGMSAWNGCQPIPKKAILTKPWMASPKESIPFSTRF